jgi:hypothetical protein
MATTVLSLPAGALTVSLPTGSQFLKVLDTAKKLAITVQIPSATEFLKVLDTHKTPLVQTVLIPSATYDDPVNIEIAGLDNYFVYDDSEGTFEDYSTEVGTPTIDDVFDMATDPAGIGDCVYLGNEFQFDMVFVNITTQSGTNQSGHGVWEYWDGDSWESLTMLWREWMSITGTGNGYIQFSEPGDWATTTINSEANYYIRWRFTSASNPTARRRMATVTIRQTFFPAPSIGYYPAGVATFAHFTKWTQATVAWATNIQTEFESYQRDYASAAGDFTWLASRLAVLRASDGTWKPDTMTHGAFSPTIDQHHTQFHLTNHLVGMSDAIQSAVNARGGYLATTYRTKLASLASNATRNKQWRSIINTNHITTDGFRCKITLGNDIAYMGEQTSRLQPTSYAYTRVVGNKQVIWHMEHPVYHSGYASSMWCRHRVPSPVDWWFWGLGFIEYVEAPLWAAPWISQQVMLLGH